MFPDCGHHPFPLLNHQGEKALVSSAAIHRAGQETAHAMLRQAINQVTGDTEPIISRSEAGKPYLPEHPDLFISISHSREMAIVALAGIPIGVDLESCDRVVSHLEISRRYFSSSEDTFLAAQTPGAQGSVFMDLWMAREAAAKCSGAGLAGCLEGASCELEFGGVTAIRTTQGRFLLNFVDLGGPWRACVAAEMEGLEIQRLRWPLEDEGLWKIP